MDITGNCKSRGVFTLKVVILMICRPEKKYAYLIENRFVTSLDPDPVAEKRPRQVSRAFYSRVISVKPLSQI